MGAGDAWESLLERSISAFYEGQFAEGRLACDRLLCLPDLPAHVRDVTRTNQVHYAQPIDELAASFRESTISPAGVSESAGGVGRNPLDPDSAAFQDLRALLDRGNAIDQGRWLSVVNNDVLYVIASLGPTVAVRCDLQTGALALEAFHDAPFVAQDLYGGAQLVELDDGFLAIVFDVVTWESGEQTVLHRFVRFDPTFRISSLSHPFRLPGSGVASADGLSRAGDSLELTYDAGRDGAVAALKLSEALALLHPITHLAPRGAHTFAMPEALLAALPRWDSPGPAAVRAVDLPSMPVLRPEDVIAVMPRRAQAIGIADQLSTTGPLLRDVLFGDRSPYLDFPLTDHPPDLQGWSTGHPMFEQVMRQLRPRRIIEVGSWKGASAIAMARLCQTLDVPCEEIVCVDTWLGGPENVIEVSASGAATQSPWFRHLRHKHGYPQLYYTFLRNVIDAGFTEIITPLPLSSDSAATVLERYGYVADLVYVDAGHEYESVRADLHHFWKIIAPGGVLFGDDYANPEHPGVRSAVDEFCTAMGVELTADAFTYVIVKSPRA